MNPLDDFIYSVVELKGIEICSGSVNIIMEYMDCGSLSQVGLVTFGSYVSFSILWKLDD